MPQQNHAAGKIKHVFVLMLENRSFDHMLGFSGITGTDAVSGQPTAVRGLSGTETQVFNAVTYPVVRSADFVMPIDPSHEFLNVISQLCGNAKYQAGGAYPPINSSGFVADYVASGGQSSPGEIMKCYDPLQLPVLTALAREFAVCDSWHSSMPGPTWPNRFFVHAASAGGLDHSPTSGEIAQWETFSGFEFEKGTIFALMDAARLAHGWRIYAGGTFPNVAAVKGITNFQIHDLDDFASDVASPGYLPLYTFIEPNYGDVVFSSFKGGNSQHPMDDVTHGETLIKSVYEAIRKSPLWDNSLLIVTWDEHGGFYDHVQPPAAVSPGDQIKTGGASQFGFTFGQYGVRVPAVVVSPLIKKNVIDPRLYDHACVPATIEAIFGLPSLTARDGQANNLTSLVSLSSPRTDTPMTLPSPAVSAGMTAMAMMAPRAASPADSIDKGNLPGFLHAALKSDLDLSRPEQRAAILTQFNAIKTRADAQHYMDQVGVKVRAARAASKMLSRQSEGGLAPAPNTAAVTAQATSPEPSVKSGVATPGIEAAEHAAQSQLVAHQVIVDPDSKTVTLPAGWQVI